MTVGSIQPRAAYRHPRRSAAITAQRARAYAEVVELLNDIPEDRLSEPERERVRTAADNLVLCRDLHADETARATIVDLESLARQLADKGWSEMRAGELVWAVIACAPVDPVIHRAAA